VSEQERRLVHGQVCYLQLPAVDRARAAAFYQAVFGWEVEQHHPDFTAPGGLIGQWVTDRPPIRDNGPVIWMQVADMSAALQRVVKHGGRALDLSADGPTRDLATIVDSEGNCVGLAAHRSSPRLAVSAVSASGGMPPGNNPAHSPV
jgi:predicted enzyme related to lactoylglutathione lyase